MRLRWYCLHIDTDVRQGEGMFKGKEPNSKVSRRKSTTLKFVKVKKAQKQSSFLEKVFLAIVLNEAKQKVIAFVEMAFKKLRDIMLSE